MPALPETRPRRVKLRDRSRNRNAPWSACSATTSRQRSHSLVFAQGTGSERRHVRRDHNSAFRGAESAPRFPFRAGEPLVVNRTSPRFGTSYSVVRSSTDSM
jgi:hypothetical protein